MSTGFAQRDALHAELRSAAEEVSFDAAPEAGSKLVFGKGAASLLTSFAVHALILLACGFIAWGVDADLLKTFMPAINASFSDEEIEDDEAYVELGKIEFEMKKQAGSKNPLVWSPETELPEVEVPARMIEQVAGANGTEGEGESQEGAEEETQAQFRFQKSKAGNAVTKGSFTVWTDPSDPIPFEDYYLVIQIRVPEGMTEFPADDLRIQVKGTDGFYLKIPDTARNIRLLSDLKVVNGEVQLPIFIPGTHQHVRDQILIESRRVLNERQELEIIF